MTLRLIPLAGLMLLSACAHRGDAALPTCDGSARRPANPHGSVLSPPATSPVLQTQPASEPSTEGGCT